MQVTESEQAVKLFVQCTFSSKKTYHQPTVYTKLCNLISPFCVRNYVRRKTLIQSIQQSSALFHDLDEIHYCQFHKLFEEFSSL